MGMERHVLHLLGSPNFLERLVDEGLDSPSAPGVPTPERLACMMENGNLASMA